jgi:hypothetical protein
MPQVLPSSLSLQIDGKIVDVHSDKAKIFELNKALANPAGFKDFANDPKSFAAKFGLGIDPQISGQLKSKLIGINSLSELAAIHGGGGGVGATVWAVAGGAYSISSSKIAVAF